MVPILPSQCKPYFSVLGQLNLHNIDLHPDLHKDIKGLSESPQEIMQRMSDLAIRLVTTNDELLGSIEALECVMIESVFQANIGNLRRSWIACRRAMNIAQLMGLNRPRHKAHYEVLDPGANYHPHLMWFRILFLDRHLCLMLGFPQGSLDRNMGSEEVLATDTPMGRLERIHCVVASRILERNESRSSIADITLTRAIDKELQGAVRSLPSKWWLTPDLDSKLTDAQGLFWNTRRLFAQLMHYNLLNQLHLPHMLHSFSAGCSFEYSRLTCANASREVLSRFITLRSFNGIAYSCRTVDFLALMAALTLLLAHLDSRRHPTDAGDLLAHQYHSDRAMIEKVQENMEEVNRLNSDALSAESADLLRRLLTIDGDTTGSTLRKVDVVQEPISTMVSQVENSPIVSVHIPYFGTIQVSREGINKEASKPGPALEPTRGPAKSAQSASLPDAPVYSQNNTMLSAEGGTSVAAGYSHSNAHLRALATPDTDVTDLYGSQLFRQEQYPGLVAVTEDWALQGVDAFFFESLTGGANNEGGKSTVWPTMVDINDSS